MQEAISHCHILISSIFHKLFVLLSLLVSWIGPILNHSNHERQREKENMGAVPILVSSSNKNKQQQ